MDFKWWRGQLKVERVNGLRCEDSLDILLGFKNVGTEHNKNVIAPANPWINNNVVSQTEITGCDITDGAESATVLRGALRGADPAAGSHDGDVQRMFFQLLP